MIGMLAGRVEAVDASAALIMAGGIGFETRMPAADLSALHAGQEVNVYTSLNVSQDAITLFGFLAQASKRMFMQLQKVSGIGPKVALSLLSTLPPDKLARAVADGDATALANGNYLITANNGTLTISQRRDLGCFFAPFRAILFGLTFTFGLHAAINGHLVLLRQISPLDADINDKDPILAQKDVGFSRHFFHD